MKKLSAALLFGTLALTACGGDKTPAVSAVTSVSGTVVERDTTKGDELNLVTMPWTGGAGKVVMFSRTADELATGTLNANGSFSLALPANVATDQLGDYNPNNDTSTSCTGKFSVSDPNVRGTSAQLGVVANKTGTIQPTLGQGSYNAGSQTGEMDITVGVLLYVDRAVNMTGSSNCKVDDTPGTMTINMHLAKGWNLITVTEKGIMNKGVYSMNMTMESGKLPTNNWLYSAIDEQSLKSQSLKIPNFF